MDDLRKLVLFRDVVSLGGFTAAARKWGLSHSTVSKHIKTLEQELGARLLERTSRTMRLTAAGEIAFEHSDQIGATYRDMRQRLDTSAAEVTGELRIGSLLHLGRDLLQPAVTSFLRAYPSARITTLLADDPLAFYRNELDLALTVGLPTEGTLIATRLLENRVCLAATPELLEQAGPLQHPDELARYPTVAYTNELARITSWVYTEDGQPRTVTVRPVLSTTDGNALLDAVRSGLGVGYLSAFSAWADLRSGRLVRVLPEFELPPYQPVYLLRAPSEYVPARIEAFREQLESVARELDDPR
ncbi:MAG: LysR family transcriptional regulator [Planctomycetota bacterium]